MHPDEEERASPIFNLLLSETFDVEVVMCDEIIT